MGAPQLDLDPRLSHLDELGAHWSADEIASFVCHPGSGRVLVVGGGGELDELSDVLEDAGYRLGRLPLTREASHLPHAAATFMPHVIYVTLTRPLAPCLDALELLGSDARTHDVPLVALVGPEVGPEDLEDAYTRSGCDFLRADASAIEYLARTHLLARLAHALAGVGSSDIDPVRLHETPRATAANDDPRAPLSLLDRDSGAHSAHYLAQRLPTEIARATRYERDLSILVVDCPAAADSPATAAEVSARLRDHCRDPDLVARADASRFVLLLPETPRDGAEVLAERIEERLQSEGLSVETNVLDPKDPAMRAFVG